jgi:hypothetical protein
MCMLSWLRCVNFKADIGYRLQEYVWMSWTEVWAEMCVLRKRVRIVLESFNVKEWAEKLRLWIVHMNFWGVANWRYEENTVLQRRFRRLKVMLLLTWNISPSHSIPFINFFWRQLTCKLCNNNKKWRHDSWKCSKVWFLLHRIIMSNIYGRHAILFVTKYTVFIQSNITRVFKSKYYVCTCATYFGLYLGHP